MRFLPWWTDETGRKNKMKFLIALAALTATPAFAHSAAGATHIPHSAYLIAVGAGVFALAAYNAVKR